MSRRIALTALLALSLASCGGDGGSGNDNPNNVLFSGDYFVCAIEGLETNDIEVDSNFGTGNADGAGTFTGSTEQNSNGTVNGPFDFTLPYDVDPDRILLFQGVRWQGALTPDGSLGSLATIVDNSIPQLQMVLRKPENTQDASALNGAYRFGYWRRTAIGQNVCSMGTMTFDGAGNWTSVIDVTNTDGAPVAGGGEAGTYTVAADGTVELTFGGTTDTLRGGVREGGDAAFLGGTIASGFPAKLLLIRAATSASAGIFLGSYFVTAFGRVNAGGYESVVGLITANGAGAFEFSFTTNANGSVLPAALTGGTFGVGADGTLSVDFGPELTGGIISSGEVAFLAGGTNTGSGPLLLFLIRR